MRRLLRAGLAAAALHAAARAGEPARPAAPPIEVLESGTATLDVAGGGFTLDGGAWLRREALSLRAGRASWDPVSRTLRAEGGVLLSEPGRALAADSLRLTVGGTFEARGVRAWLKEGTADLGGCTSAGEVERQGRNRVTFAGERLSGRQGEESVQLDRARITPCDCGGGAPSWEVRARHADVEPGKRALLDWPVLYVTPRFLGLERPVPVLALPWGYLPLAERQTGLLVPELAFDHNGFSAGLPLFLVLSRSWDATVTPQWITGTGASRVAKDERGVRGPGLGLELRWAPAEGASGLARLHLVHSTISAWPADAWRPPDGDRLSFRLVHRQRLLESTSLVASLSAVGDPFYAADFSGDLLERGAEYRRSALAVESRGAGALLWLEGSYLEPLAGTPATASALRSGDPARRAPFGPFGTDLSTFHRLPALGAELLPRPLAGPLRIAGRLELARFAPLRGSTGDEGDDGLGPGDPGWGATPTPRPGERDGLWQPGERLAASRALARLELSAPLRAGRWLEAEPWAAATGAGYLFEGAPGPQADARLAGGVALSTEVSRRFGEGEGRLLHAVAPRLEWRAGSGGASRALPSGYAYDGQDLSPAPALVPGTPTRALSAAPGGSWQQLRLALRNRLVAADGPLSRAALDLDLGQDLDLASGRRAESFATLALRAPLVTADAGARFYALGARRPPGIPGPARPSSLDRIAELRAGVSVGGPRAEFHASFAAVGPGGSQRLAAGDDPLFDPRPLAFEPVAQGSAGFRVRWSAATLSYDADFNARDLPAPLAVGGRRGPHVFQQTARLAWDSPCRCFRLGLLARLGDAGPSASLTFDLSPRGAAPERR